MRRAVLALFLLLVVSGTAVGVGEWRINDAFTSPQNISNNSQLITIGQIQYNTSQSSWQPVTPSRCSDINVLYNYDTQNNQEMTYIPESSGFFYATPTVGDHDSTIEIIAQGTCNSIDSPGPVEDTLVINTQHNLSITTPNSTEEMDLLEGTNATIWANSTYDNSFTPGVELQWSLRDEKGTEIDQGTMQQQNSRFNASIQLPGIAKRFYYLRITGKNTTDVGFKNATGGTAIPLNVERRLSGTLRLNNTAGECSEDMSSCEKGATINATFNTTAAEADNVTGRVEGNGNNITRFNFTKNTLWEANFTIPDSLNTTKYGSSIDVHAGARNDLSNISLEATLPIEPFNLQEETTSFVFQGTDIDLIFGPFSPFSNLPLDRSQIARFNISVMYPNGTEMTNITIGDTSIPDPYYIQDQKLLTYPLTIPSNAPTGTYTFEIDVHDLYGTTKTNTFSFDVYERGEEESNVQIIDISSSLTDTDSQDTIEKILDEPTTQSGSIVIKNNGTEEGTVRIHLSENLSGITTYDVSYLSGPPINLAPNSAATVEFDFSPQDHKTYLGDITFMVDGSSYAYNRTVSVNFTVPQQACEHVNGSLCVNTDAISEDITNTPATFNISLTNDNDTTITYTPEGNISNVLESGEQSLTANEQTNITLSLANPLNGFYSGNISLTTEAGDRVRVPIDLQLDIPVGDMSLSLNNPELGSYVIGDTIAFQVQIENNGDTTLSDIVLQNSQLAIDTTVQDSAGQNISLGEGESHVEELTIDTAGLSPLDAGVSNPLTLLATTGSGLQETAEFQLTLIRNIENDIQSLKNRVSTLRNRLATIREQQGEQAVSSVESNMNRLGNAINNSEEAWEQGNYGDASSSYETATQLETQVETQLNNIETPSGQEPPGNESTDETDNGGGGLPIMLIVVILLILVVVGVVIYLSLVPEDDEQETQLGSLPRSRQ